MQTYKHTIGISVILGMLLWSFYSLAVDVKPKEPKAGPQTFKSVMLLLQASMNTINNGIMTENYAIIEKQGHFIAHHPRPPMTERKKLARALGPRLKDFKKIDKLVHGTAEKLTRAAKAKNMALVVTHYHTIIKACVNCHSVVRPLFRANKKPLLPKGGAL